MTKLLLHTCCACCSAHVVELLKKEYDVVMFFSNSNIYPKEEYDKRLESAKVIAEKMKVKLVEDSWDNEAWLKAVKGLEKEPEKGKRCAVCFRFNLERTAKFAAENKFDLFATTLTISPHKDAVLINKIGTELGEKYKIKYLESDFKKQDGFKHSTELSREMGLYRQGWCGCGFSMRKNHDYKDQDNYCATTI